MHRQLARSLVTAAILAAPIPLAPKAVEAQEGFLFKPPIATVEVRLAWAMYTADSDLYRHITSELTLEKDDFTTFSAGADLALTVATPVDLVLGLAYSRSETASEFRDFVDLDDMPIQQVTEVSHMPITAGLRFYPVSRGRSLGRYAWVPTRFTPYIGAGAGMNRYTFEQTGDFVDEEDLSIFSDELRSSGTAFTLYGEAGGAYWLNQRLGLTAGARYTFGEATMDDDFQGSALDLRGFQGSAGLAIRF